MVVVGDRVKVAAIYGLVDHEYEPDKVYTVAGFVGGAPILKDERRKISSVNEDFLVMESESVRTMSFTNTEKAVLVVRRYRQRAPWRGTHERKLEKAQWLIDKLSEVYGVTAPRVHIPEQPDPQLEQSLGYYNAVANVVAARKFSVITLIHEFAHKLGMGQMEAVEWSTRVFFEAWPDKRDELIQSGELWIRPEQITEDRSGELDEVVNQMVEDNEGESSDSSNSPDEDSVQEDSDGAGYDPNDLEGDGLTSRQRARAYRRTADMF